MIDLHCHVLPGIDDGPPTIEASLALARAAAETGTRTLVATPHVSRLYPNDINTILRLTSELNARLASERTEVVVKPGAEIALTHLADVEPLQLTRLGLGGSRWLLVEPPFLPTAMGIDVAILDLQRRGYGVVLAHPERCPVFQRDPRLLGSLVRVGVMTSITAGSLVGHFGDNVRRFALKLVAEEMVHDVASDAHDHVRRPPGLSAQLERVGLGPLADWFTHQVPGAILADREIPPRPVLALPGFGQRRLLWPRAGGIGRLSRSWRR
jgi:protein-tyrosine phosphatase